MKLYVTGLNRQTIDVTTKDDDIHDFVYSGTYIDYRILYAGGIEATGTFCTTEKIESFSEAEELIKKRILNTKEEKGE